MNNTEIVQALKENRTPLCKMSMELRKKMASIESKKFQILQTTSTPEEDVWGSAFYCGPDIDRKSTCIYRLHPDYKEEQEVVECPYATKLINEDYCVEGYIHDGQFQPLNYIPDGYRPSGFKYADGNIHLTSVWHNGPRDMSCEHIFNGSSTVLTPTHVLFKGKDNE